MADALDLKSSGVVHHAGSSPVASTVVTRLIEDRTPINRHIVSSTAKSIRPSAGTR